MRVIVVASQKGGAGKTTLASHLAVEAERQGVSPVVVIDTDPQGGLADWYNVREAPSPAFVQPGPGGLPATLLELAAAGVQLVIIDTPPAITASIAATLVSADLVVVPARPSPNDLRAIGGTVNLVEQAGKPMVFVINSVKPRVRLTNDAVLNLSQHGTVAPIMISDRIGYAAAMIDGRTAPELEPNGPAAVEMAGLWTYLGTRLEKGREARHVA